MSLQHHIESKLIQDFRPDHLEVVNESYKHNVAEGAESHFKVVIVSNQFQDCSLIQRHRMVNEVLQQELAGPIHALSIQAMTEEQWLAKNKQSKDTPDCMGGGK